MQRHTKSISQLIKQINKSVNQYHQVLIKCPKSETKITYKNRHSQQESRAVARKPRDAAAVRFKVRRQHSQNQKSKVRLQTSKHTGEKQNLTKMAIQGHSIKVTDFGTNRKRICNFLLVINRNLGPILPSSIDIADFLFRTANPTLFHPNFADVPLGLDCRCCGSKEP